jgi:hypothetical protein
VPRPCLTLSSMVCCFLPAVEAATTIVRGRYKCAEKSCLNVQSGGKTAYTFQGGRGLRKKNTRAHPAGHATDWNTFELSAGGGGGGGQEKPQTYMVGTNAAQGQQRTKQARDLGAVETINRKQVRGGNIGAAYKKWRSCPAREHVQRLNGPAQGVTSLGRSRGHRARGHRARGHHLPIPIPCGRLGRLGCCAGCTAACSNRPSSASLQHRYGGGGGARRGRCGRRGPSPGPRSRACCRAPCRRPQGRTWRGSSGSSSRSRSCRGPGSCPCTRCS